MLASLCHQAKQPLTALHGVLELAMVQGNDEKPCREALEHSLHQADRLIEIIDLMSELVESSKPARSLDRVVWSDVIRDAIEELRPLAQARGVQITFPAAERRFVHTDSLRLFDATRRALRCAILSAARNQIVNVSLTFSARSERMYVTAPGVPVARINQTSTPSRPSQDFSKMNIEWWMISQFFKQQGGHVSFANKRGVEHTVSFELPLLSRRVPSKRAGENRAIK